MKNCKIEQKFPSIVKIHIQQSPVTGCKQIVPVKNPVIPFINYSMAITKYLWR